MFFMVKRLILVLFISVLGFTYLSGCGVEPEEEPTEPEVEEEVEADIGLTVDEFKENWNAAVTSWMDDSEMFEHYFIDEFHEEENGSGFAFRLDSGLTLMGFENENGKIREIDIRSEKEAFNENYWWHKEAWRFFIVALGMDLTEEERAEFLASEMGVDDEMTWVDEDMEFKTDDYILTLNMYRSIELVSFSAIAIE